MNRIFLLGLVVLLAGCGSTPKSGGYYKDDGPHERPPANLDRVTDAVPRNEPLHKSANRPYTALGKNYVPMTSVQPFRQRGVASWYGKRYHGQKTSSGETYDMYQMSAAHPTLPIPSYVRVTNVANGKSVVVRINDRGPFHSARIIDLSYVAAYKLGFVQSGQAQVEVESVIPGKRAGL
jgi:rare lipoprotein A